MKIYWINNISDKYHYKTARLGFTEALRKRGHEVTLIMARHFTEKKPHKKKFHIYQQLIIEYYLD